VAYLSDRPRFAERRADQAVDLSSHGVGLLSRRGPVPGVVDREGADAVAVLDGAFQANVSRLQSVLIERLRDERAHLWAQAPRVLEEEAHALAELIDEYRLLIEAWSQTADRYRASKPAVDFPRYAGRRAQRAISTPCEISQRLSSVSASCASRHQSATRTWRSHDSSRHMCAEPDAQDERTTR
jgi:hypothetical protein